MNTSVVTVKQTHQPFRIDPAAARRGLRRIGAFWPSRIYLPALGPARQYCKIFLVQAEDVDQLNNARFCARVAGKNPV
jgi:hypothetical protein